MHRKDEDKSQVCKPYEIGPGYLFTVVDLTNESRSKSIVSEKDNLLLFLLHGELSFGNELVESQRLKGREFAFIEAPFSLRMNIKQDSCAMILYYRDSLWITSPEMQENGSSQKVRFCNHNFVLPVKEPLLLFLNQLRRYHMDGLDFSQTLYDVKLRELTFIFEKYYSDEASVEAFRQNVSTSLDFRTKVMSTYQQAKTAKELADLCGYGLKSFQRMFRLHFNETPYQWMRKQMVAPIEDKLKDESIPIKQIVAEYGFSSVSHFNTYCRKYFGATPKAVRGRKSDE